MNIQPVDIVIHLINIVVLYVILRLILYKPVKAFMSKREEGIQTSLKRADEAAQNVHQAQEDLNRRMKDADAQVENHLLQGMQKAGETANDLVKKAQAQAAEIIEKAGADAKEMKKQAVRSATPEMAQMAVQLAGEILKREINPEDQKQVIDDFVSKAV